jgi:hypothetical protein
MAVSEINLVLDLVEKGAAAVEKATHVLWSRDDLLEARSHQQFQHDDQITEPTGDEAVTSLYPGCPNMMGKIPGSGEPIAETTHFLLFERPGGSHPFPLCRETMVEAADLS